MIFRSPFRDITIPEVPLDQFMFQRAHEWKDKVAIVDGPTGRTLSYAQVTGSVRRVAAGLTQRGFQKGDVFAIFLPNLPEYALAFFGVAAMGGVNTTINPLYTAEELANQLNDTSAKYLLTIPQFMDKVSAAVKQSKVQEVFVLGEAAGATPFAELTKNDGQLPAVPINAREDLVVLPYSSGTGGRPKGVMLTHYNLVAQMSQLEAAGVFREDETLVAVLPFFHIAGMLGIMMLGLWQGAKIVTMPRFDFEQFLQLSEKHGATRATLVPPIVLALAKHPLVAKYNLSTMRLIYSAAAPLDANLERACAERLHCVIGQAYGMTEVSGASHVIPDDPAKVKAGSVGFVVSQMECQLVDVAMGQELGPNEPGEILMRGPNVMKGYLNNPEATAQTIDAEGWLHSGDVGYADDEGYFFIVDRVKELIKYKAMQVAPAELEAVLLTNPAIADAAVIPSADEEAGEVPKAFVVLKSPLTAEEIIAFAAARVAPYKKIRKVEIVDSIPKSASGKILRRVLVERERASLSR